MTLDKFGRHSHAIDRETLEQNILATIESKLIQNSMGNFNNELKILNERLNEIDEILDNFAKRSNLYEKEVKDSKEKFAQYLVEIDDVKNSLLKEVKPFMDMANKNKEAILELDVKLNSKISILELDNRDNHAMHDMINEKITNLAINLEAEFDKKLKQLESRPKL